MNLARARVAADRRWGSEYRFWLVQTVTSRGPMLPNNESPVKDMKVYNKANKHHFRDTKKPQRFHITFFHYTNLKVTISTLPVTISTSHTLRMYSASASSSAAPAKPSSSSMASAVLLSFKENFNQFCFHCNNVIKSDFRLCSSYNCI